MLFLVEILGTSRSQEKYRPELIFREDWKETPAEIPLSQKHVNNPDLSNVEEIGFTDLMPGGKSSSCSRLDWIEVYGKPIKR